MVMNRKQLQHILNKWAPQVAELYGVQNQDLRVRIAELDKRGDNRYAEGDAARGRITVDPDFLTKYAKGRRDIRGMLIHEATHTLGIGAGKSAKRVEGLADAARLALNPREAGYWNPSDIAQNIAEKRGFMTGNNQGGVPGPSLPGPGGNRMRNTFSNALSKNQVDYTNPGGKSALPVLDPAAEAAYYQQLQALYADYQTQLSALKQQRVGIRADARIARTDVRSQKLADLAGNENAQIERNMLGSSADVQTRAGIEGAAAAGQAAISNQKLQALAQNRIAAQQAGTQYFMGMAGLEADKVAQQQQLLAQQLQNNLIVSGQEAQIDALRAIYNSFVNRNGGGGGGGNGRPARNPDGTPAPVGAAGVYDEQNYYGGTPAGTTRYGQYGLPGGYYG